MRSYVQEGNTLPFTVPYAVDSGGGCKIGALFGAALYPGDQGTEVELRVKGVVTLPRTGAALNPGDRVYWDDTARVVTNIATGNMLIGGAATAAAADSPTADVLLNGVVLP